MTKRSLRDTEAEAEARVTHLLALLERGNCGTAFVRFHVRKLIDEVTDDILGRRVENARADAEREWTTAEPVPSGNGVARVRAVAGAS